MIVRTTFRRAGGLEAHLLRSDTNTSVRVRTDLIRGADDLNTALRLMAGLALTNTRVKRAFVHVVISPDHAFDESDLARTLAMIEEEHGISSDAPRVVVEHEKGARPNHFHAVYAIIDPATGKAIRSNKNFEADELISRRLELLFNERIIPGPRTAETIAELRRRGFEHEAERLAAHAPVRHADGLSRKDRRQADRLDIDAQRWSRKAFAIFEREDRDLPTFARAIEGLGYGVALGDRAMLLVDDATGYASSFVRLLRREAKAAGRPLDITEQQLAEAFPDAQPFAEVRSLGFDRARKKARQEIEVEFLRATTEAHVDGDVAALDDFRRRQRRRAEKEQARVDAEAAATLKARREAIQALYRERDAIRRARVDRAFRWARLLDTPAARRTIFALAAAGVLLTGGSLALALAGGIGGMGLVPSRARARALAASAARERTEDAARRRAEIDSAFRAARATARRRGPAPVRFSFEHVAKEDRVLAGAYAEALLHGNAAPRGSFDLIAQALGPEVTAGIDRMLERGSPLQVRRLVHWHRGIAANRREGAVSAALQRHAAARAKTEPHKSGQHRTRSNTSASNRRSRQGPEM